MRPFWKKHLGDGIVISAFSVLALCLALYAALPKGGSSSHQAEITLDGKRLSKNGLIDLSTYGEEETTFSIQGYHDEMTIGVRRNEIRIVHSDCPSQYCVHQGWIKDPGRPLVCAYNHIVITVLGEKGADIIL